MNPIKSVTYLACLDTSTKKKQKKKTTFRIQSGLSLAFCMIHFSLRFEVFRTHRVDGNAASILCSRCCQTRTKAATVYPPPPLLALSPLLSSISAPLQMASLTHSSPLVYSKQVRAGRFCLLWPFFIRDKSALMQRYAASLPPILLFILTPPYPPH